MHHHETLKHPSPVLLSWSSRIRVAPKSFIDLPIDQSLQMLMPRTQYLSISNESYNWGLCCSASSCNNTISFVSRVSRRVDATRRDARPNTCME